MKLTSEKALKLIEKEHGKKQGNERWINHSICVGNTASVIANALNLDEDFAKTLGYIHDIGKKFEYKEKGVFPHAIKGYEYIKSLGYDEVYAGICIKHSFLNNDIDCISNDRDETDKQNHNYEFVKEYIKKNIQYMKKLLIFAT